MENSKKYKLYKSGKLLVVAAVAVAGVAVSANTTKVSADTTNTDAQAVKTTDTTQNDKQVPLQPAASNEQSSEKTAQAEQVTSDVPTSVAQNTTPDEAKSTIDKAQETVKGNVETAKGAGVEVTQGATQDVTLNKDNAGSKSNEILNDLNKQDQAVKQAIATQQENDKAYADTTASREKTMTQGQSDMNQATAKLQNSTDEAKKAGVIVVENHTIETPQYKDLTGLTGKSLVEASMYNETQYKLFVAKYADLMSKNAEANELVTQGYIKVNQAYLAEVARVHKANADKKAKHDQEMNAFNNGVNHQQFMTAKTDTDAASGQYQTFMTSEVNQTTGEFTLKHDMNDGVHVIGNGELKGKVDYTVKSNGDGTETITITGVHLHSYTYTNHYQNQAVNQNINFHVYDLNGHELFVVAHNGNSSFNRDINQSFALNKSFVLAAGQKSDEMQFLIVDDNWIWNTHGKVYFAIQNTNEKPKDPNYEPEPLKPDVPKVAANYYTIVAMPAPETPEQQKVSVHFYNVSVAPEPAQPKEETPVQPKAETPKVVTQSSVLPKTGSEANNGSLFFGIASTLASLGLLGAISKKFKKQK